MRKHSFLFGLLTGACMFGGITVLANTDVLARLTSQVFYYNGSKIELEAYNINDYNYVRLRDAAELFGVKVEYDGETDSVYLGEKPAAVVKPSAGNGKSDGKAHAREDYSQSANSEIFDSVYTRDAYNAIKQSLVDVESITAGANEDGYNPDYNYANFVDGKDTLQTPGDTVAAMNSVIGGFNGYYLFRLGSAVHIDNIYEYPGYRICQIWLNKKLEPAKEATDGFVEEIKGLPDANKIQRIADLVCDKIVYKDENVGGLNEVFTSAAPVNGICGTYASAFQYLCLRAGIPCLVAMDQDHAWNEVYVNGAWKSADMGYYDVGRPQAQLLIDKFRKADTRPQRLKFAKELLVPMSTK